MRRHTAAGGGREAVDGEGVQSPIRVGEEDDVPVLLGHGTPFPFVTRNRARWGLLGTVGGGWECG